MKWKFNKFCWTFRLCFFPYLILGQVKRRVFPEVLASVRQAHMCSLGAIPAHLRPIKNFEGPSTSDFDSPCWCLCLLFALLFSMMLFSTTTIATSSSSLSEVAGRWVLRECHFKFVIVVGLELFACNKHAFLRPTTRKLPAFLRAMSAIGQMLLNSTKIHLEYMKLTTCMRACVSICK